jgi:asparagine synthase (glutamine-hydrolysing)
MCGIAGIMSLSDKIVRLEEIRSMCDTMIHRGPDDEGFHTGPGIGLGMRRLSIIDVKSGHQPVHNEDGTVSVVFNGEIYNFDELRRDLETQGHTFRTHSDTEVIVHSYEQYGVNCVDRMRGMFAFAVWDQKDRKLFIARDRLGKKPLYYTVTGERLIFGSELKVVLQAPQVERRINWRSFHHYLSTLCTPLDESIVAGVHKLPPGHYLTASPASGIQVKQYWDLRFEPDYSKSERDFIELLRAHICESVKMRMISEVPLGAFLSGGVDSSSVVAMMARLSPRPVKTFSIGFAEREFNELDYARCVAQRFGTEHHDLIVEPDVLGMIDDLAWYLDEPFADSSAIPTYMVSKLASERVTVVLSGDGGDELFAGYDRYVVAQREQRYDSIPRPFRKMAGSIGRIMPEGMKGRNFLRHLAYDGIDRYLDSGTLFRIADMPSVLTPNAFRQIQSFELMETRRQLVARQERHWLSSLQYLDTKLYLANDILTKVDRMSMAHSIEARVPLLDHKLVEFAATIPPELKLRGNTTKYIFKKAMEGILPKDILYRPKRGFAVPLSRWFRGQLNGYVRDLLLDSTSRQRGIFNPNYVERLLRLHENGRDMDLQLWTMITFELWCRRFLHRRIEDHDFHSVDRDSIATAQ